MCCDIHNVVCGDFHQLTDSNHIHRHSLIIGIDLDACFFVFLGIITPTQPTKETRKEGGT